MNYQYLFEARTQGTDRLFSILAKIDQGVQRLVQNTAKYGDAAGKTTVTINNFSRAQNAAGKSSNSFAKTMHRITGLWNASGLKDEVRSEGSRRVSLRLQILAARVRGSVPVFHHPRSLDTGF